MESAIIAILLSLVMGGVAYFLTNSNFPTGRIKVSTREFLIGAAISTVVLIIAGPITEHLIISNKEKYYEFYNGYETAAISSVTVCERDGQCHYTYNCDPYLVVHTYEDSKGRTHTYVTTEYHSCPYLTHELTYSIDTTLGIYPIDESFADAHRQAWRSDEAVPSDIPTGPPQLWKEAQARLASRKPGGVTKVVSYKNYLLASDKTILDQYSADISNYTSKNLLPDTTKNYSNPIYNMYQADKFNVVQLSVDTKLWNEYLNRLNGYLGNELQGDVHVTAVNASLIKNPDDYSQALFAYWKGPHFGRYALSKNAIAIVIGVDDGKITWARATGGLPVGNEALFLDIQNNLVGASFDPVTVIGIPKTSPGVLTSTLYGIDKFKRPCMDCIGKNVNGYAYLKSDVYVTGWQRFWFIFTAVSLSAVMWAMFLYVDDNLRTNNYY